MFSIAISTEVPDLTGKYTIASKVGSVISSIMSKKYSDRSVRFDVGHSDQNFQKTMNYYGS